VARADREGDDNMNFSHLPLFRGGEREVVTEIRYVRTRQLNGGMSSDLDFLEREYRRLFYDACSACSVEFKGNVSNSTSQPSSGYFPNSSVRPGLFLLAQSR